MEVSNENQKTDRKKGKALSTRANNPIVNMIDATLWETGVDPKSQFNPWNPDDIFQKAGDYTIYEDMLNDDQVSVAMAIKKDLIIGGGWHIVCESDDDDEIKEDIEQALKEDFSGSFDDSLNEILSAYEYGFSVTEKQFDTRKDGSLFLKNLKTRAPVNWLFHQDDYGNITKYEQQGTSGEKFSNINPNAIVHFINNPKFGNPYGRSDLRAAYEAYFIKKQIVRYYAIFLEKAASPTPIAKYDKAVAEDEDIQTIHNAIKRFQVSTALTIPKEFEIEFIESKSNGEAYTKGISMFNMFIGRAMFLPDLLGFQGAPTTGGSQALGREQMFVFFKHIMRRRRTLENIVNKHFIKPLVLWNFGEVDHYPKFKLNPIEPDQAVKLAELWLKAVQGRAYRPTPQDINHFKQIVEFPESEIEDLENDPIEDAAIDPPFKDLVPEKEKYAFKLPKGDYHKKVDFKALEARMDSDLDMVMSKFKLMKDEILEALSKELRRKKVTDLKGLSNLDNIKIPKSKRNKLQKILDEEMLRVFNDSSKRAQLELQKSEFNIKPDTFVVQPAEEFLKVLMAENFNFINDWEYSLSKGARIAAIQAIKDGRAISDVIEFINEELSGGSSVAMERYSRTKITEVMNKGRLAYFKDSKVVAGYQYSAIMDGRTTGICAGLNGKIFKSGTEPVPPMHFNCRSVLIPITIYEEFTPDESVGERGIDEFIDTEKGKGFSRQ